MSQEEIVVEEIKQEEDKPSDTPAQPATKPAETTPEPQTEGAPDQPPEKVAGKDAKPKKETKKANGAGPALEPVWMMLARLIAVGGEIAPIAVQIKSMLKQAMGETWTMPVPSVPAPKQMNKDEMAEMISSEVKKQLEPVLKQLPAVRKGLIETEPEGEDLKKTYEGLPPQKKLKVALALQQA